MRKALLLAIVCAIALMPAASIGQDTTMKIGFTIDGREHATATLMNKATARDFVALLPIALTLDDYAGTEISYLPRKLSTAGRGGRQQSLDRRHRLLRPVGKSGDLRRGRHWQLHG